MDGVESGDRWEIFWILPYDIKIKIDLILD
jgi:hypothetical protein